MRTLNEPRQYWGCFSKTNSWDPDFKKTSSHPSNQFAYFVYYVSLVSFLSHPNTCNEDSLKCEQPGTHTKQQTGHDCMTSLWTSNWQTLRHRQKEAWSRQASWHNEVGLDCCFWHSLQGSKRILKTFPPSAESYFIVFLSSFLACQNTYI